MAESTAGFFSVLIERFKSNNPEFFKRVIQYAYIVASVGGILIALPEFTQLPSGLQTVGGLIVALAVGIVGTANSTTTSQALRAKSEEAVK